MKQVEIKLSVDVDDAKQWDALMGLLSAMKTSGSDTEGAKEIVTEAKPKAPKAKTETKVEAPAVETKATETTAPAEDFSEGIKIEDVRALLGKKVEKNRVEIKTKLTALGANNVTNLESKHYPVFLAFLEGLK